MRLRHSAPDVAVGSDRLNMVDQGLDAFAGSGRGSAGCCSRSGRSSTSPRRFPGVRRLRSICQRERRPRRRRWRRPPPVRGACCGRYGVDPGRAFPRPTTLPTSTDINRPPTGTPNSYNRHDAGDRSPGRTQRESDIASSEAFPSELGARRSITSRRGSQAQRQSATLTLSLVPVPRH
jgi:hypothetical protein